MYFLIIIPPFGVRHAPVNRAPVVNEVQAPQGVAVVPVNVPAKRAFKFIFPCFLFHSLPAFIFPKFPFILLQSSSLICSFSFSSASILSFIESNSIYNFRFRCSIPRHSAPVPRICQNRRPFQYHKGHNNRTFAIPGADYKTIRAPCASSFRI